MANGNPVLLGNADNSTKQTTINAATPASEAGLSVQNLAGAIVAGSLGGTGLLAGSVGGASIVAESFSKLGIISSCTDTRDIPGISIAVQGTVQGGFGVGGNNVRGVFPQSGVTGRSPNAIGVDGISTRGMGVRGLHTANSHRGAAVLAVGSPGHALVAMASMTMTVPPAVPAFAPLFAGLFFGNVQVQGDFTVTGAKAAAVPHPDGTHRRLYCMEAPEAWFEDFGSARLVKGRAAVPLEKTFAALIKRNDYHLFLTPEGDCHGLYVARMTNRGFTVREMQGGKSTIRFSYRIVAHRRDLPGERLSKVTLGEKLRNADAVVDAEVPRGDEKVLTRRLRALKKPGRGKADKRASR